MTSADWTTTRPTAELFRGALDLEPTPSGILPHRLPGWVRAEYPDPQLAAAESQPSGVRMVFDTRATEIELDTVRARTVYAGLPPRPSGTLDLVVDGEVVASAETSGGTTTTIDLATNSMDREVGPVGTVRFTDLGAAEKRIEIWLPHNESVEISALRTNAPVLAAREFAEPVWIHYGSSISQGSNATHPTGIWPVVAARLGGADLINLGFSGSALLDPFVARTIRDTTADLISVKIGINVVNTDLMRLRAFGPAVRGFLDTIREGHPETPLLVVSPVYCGIQEDTPGPLAFDPTAMAAGVVRYRATGDPSETAAGKLTLAVIREELHRIVEQRRAADPNLFYLDGLRLYGADDSVHRPLPDGLHPDSGTHDEMGRRFAQLAFDRSPSEASDRRVLSWRSP